MELYTHVFILSMFFFHVIFAAYFPFLNSNGSLNIFAPLIRIYYLAHMFWGDWSLKWATLLHIVFFLLFIMLYSFFSAQLLLAAASPFPSAGIIKV